jgi:hypothetical protein
VERERACRAVYYYRKHTFVFAASQLRFSRSASFGT